MITMEREKVRRLPVVDDKGELQGILSMDDIVYYKVLVSH